MSLVWQLRIEVMMFIRWFLFAALFLSLTPSHASAAVTYSRLLNTGGAGSTFINAIAVDKSGNVYLTGSTTAADFQTTSGVVQPAIGPAVCYTVIDPHSPPEIGRASC